MTSIPFPDGAWERIQEMVDKRQSGRVTMFVKNGVVESCEVRNNFRVRAPLYDNGHDLNGLSESWPLSLVQDDDDPLSLP